MLFDQLPIRQVTLRNRIVVSPMCQYSSNDGFANDWHFVHLGSRAVGGAALVFTEAAAVTPEGRISPHDLGIWKDEHVEFLSRITRFICEQGALAGIQLAHAGRKASTPRPWDGVGTIPTSKGGWTPVGPSAIAFDDKHAAPREIAESEIPVIVDAFADAASRAQKAGFQVLEIHAAHGYLIHEFLSPITNQRTDRYGGTLDNRARLLREIAIAVRRVWPEGNPIFVRISASDYVDNGWNVEQSIELARQLKRLEIDVIDCSSGGLVPGGYAPQRPGYQVPFASDIKRGAGVMTGAVGVISEPGMADQIISHGDADLVLMAREFLRRPYWPFYAARELGHRIPWPAQYLRAAPRDTPIRGA